jgi:hypothetical protein
MELFLNLAWLFLAAAIVCLWLQGERRERKGWRRQLTAIVVLSAILFPVISMSDDLLAVQNTFEADNYSRRDHLVPCSNQPLQPALTMFAAVIFAGLGFGCTRFTLPNLVPVHEPERPELACAGNRPPPTA